MQTNHVWNRHGSVQVSGAGKASSIARIQISHWDAEAGVQCSTAGKSAVWNEGRCLLVSKDAEGKLMTIESRQAQVRRPSMAAKPMAQQGHCVCFWPDRAFAYKIEPDRVSYHLRARPMDGTSQLNSKLQEIMDIMMTEKHLEQTEKIEHVRRLPHVIKTNVDWTKGCVFFTIFWMAEHRLVRPQERSLEPLTETD